ncbi:hypothetical protein ABG067_009156, partial [Albugo candida]
MHPTLTRLWPTRPRNDRLHVRLLQLLLHLRTRSTPTWSTPTARSPRSTGEDRGGGVAGEAMDGDVPGVDTAVDGDTAVDTVVDGD